MQIVLAGLFGMMLFLGAVQFGKPVERAFEANEPQARADHFVLLLAAAQAYDAAVPYRGNRVERIPWRVIQQRSALLPLPSIYRHVSAPSGWMMVRDNNGWKVCADVDPKVVLRLKKQYAVKRSGSRKLVIGAEDATQANQAASGCS